MSGPQRNGASGTIDAGEIAHFSRLADEWWDPKGPMMPLHRLMPVRMGHIRRQLAAHFGRDADADRPLAGLKILDVGCGGGLVCEALARLGATVTGIDPSEENIGVAGLHAKDGDLSIDYRAATAEALVAEGNTFDAVLALEVVEHVADVDLFVSACADLVKPGGIALFSTINRTPLAYLVMIIGVEYVLRWLPRGTHHYDKLVTPDELTTAFAKAGMARTDAIGLKYNPRTQVFRFTRSLDVNYFMTAEKAKENG